MFVIILLVLSVNFANAQIIHSSWKDGTTGANDCGNWTIFNPNSILQCNNGTGEGAGLYIVQTLATSDDYANFIHPIPNKSTNSVGFYIRTGLNVSNVGGNNAKVISFRTTNETLTTGDNGIKFAIGQIGGVLGLYRQDASPDVLIDLFPDGTTGHFNNYTFVWYFDNENIAVFVNDTLFGNTSDTGGFTGQKNANITSFTFSTASNSHEVTSGMINFIVGNGTDLSDVIAVFADTQNPNFADSSINISNPINLDVVGLSQVVNDETLLSAYRFADNRTGTFVNSSAFSISGTSVNATFNMTLTNEVRGDVVGFEWHVTDDAGNVNTSGISAFTVANTAPSQPTILFPTDTLTTNLQPMDINVTFPADVDSDAITIFYYINDTLNQTSATNVTFNASDGVYTLNVSIFDGFDSSSNASLSFNIDTINPILTINAPDNNSIHSLSVPVDLLCTDSNPFLLNYTFFQDDTVFNSEQDETPSANQLSIVSSIDTSARASGNYGFNVSCSDVHTRKAIGNYNPVENIGMRRITFTDDENNIRIRLISNPVGYTFSNINTVKTIDRYSFDFGGTVPFGVYRFMISSDEPLIYLGTSEFNGHFVTSNNWIDFENNDISALYSVTRITAFRYFIDITTTSLNFESIGGLNIVEQFLDLEIDNTAPVPTTVLNNNTPEIDTIIQYNISCTDANGISLVAVEINTSGSFVNITTDLGLNATPFGQIINHTAVNGTFAFRSTCEDAIGNPVQSGLTTYTSTTPLDDLIPPTIDSTAIQNATPQEDDVIEINVTCSDPFSGLNNITVENNASDISFTNVSVGFFNNVTTAQTFEFNHTVVFGFISHRFTCTDGAGNSAQSGLVNYNSTEVPVAAIITAQIILPLENLGNVVGMLALLLVIIGLIFGKKVLTGNR